MADIKLFRVGAKVEELKSSAVDLEKKLQTLIERNMEKFFNVKFLASEYIIPEGRMDSVGIDENNAPVIFEYKRSKDENVISQGLFYMAWLMEHKDSFVVLAQERQHKKIAKDEIAWNGARVICVANDFTKFDQGAIKQMNANISLYRYRMFGSELLYLERMDEHDVSSKRRLERGAASSSQQQTFSAKLASTSGSIREIYENIENFIMSFGDDITQTALKYYTAFRKSSNFVCAEVFTDHVILHLKLEPKKFPFEKGFSRDVTKIGHYGTGNVQLRLKTISDFEKAKPFMRQAYDEN